MKKPTDLAVRLEAFLGTFLPGQRGMSYHTVKNYSYAFLLLYEYFREVRRITEDRLCLRHITPDEIISYLAWLEEVRNNGCATRNQRLAAIHCFFRYLQSVEPTLIAQCQRILAIQMKRSPRWHVQNHLSPNTVKEILSKPNLNTRNGRRDAALMVLLYDSGIRVNELCTLTPNQIRIEKPCHVAVYGKGRKRRIVPLLSATMDILIPYMKESGLLDSEQQNNPLFFNRQGNCLTRSGVRYIIRKYSVKLSEADADTHISPHTFRHSKAMHLLQSGNPLVVIQSVLGHSDIKTTMVYARADLDMMRKALQSSTTNAPSYKNPPKWSKPEILEWLRQL